MKRVILSLLLLPALLITGCGVGSREAIENSPTAPSPEASIHQEATVGSDMQTAESKESEVPPVSPKSEMLSLRIGDTPVSVEWEKNDSVEALRELTRESPLTISLSMYGGFEQVGSIGQSLPRDDVQTTTNAGDIVLYSGNQIVIFYGSNSWAYTRLGHITDQDAAGMKSLLGQGDVSITLTLEN